MKIPDFDIGGTLPAYVGSSPTEPAARSPFQANIQDLVDRFATSKERAKLLLGLNEYRRHLFSGGFVAGRQWIDGSFVENVEKLRGRPPRDIDLVTLFHRPVSYAGNEAQWLHDYREKIHFEFFHSEVNKSKYYCDSYSLDLDGDAVNLVRWSSYWLGLFSEQRNSARRKGIVEVPLARDGMEFQQVEAMVRKRFDV